MLLDTVVGSLVLPTKGDHSFCVWEDTRGFMRLAWCSSMMVEHGMWVVTCNRSITTTMKRGSQQEQACQNSESVNITKSDRQRKGESECTQEA